MDKRHGKNKKGKVDEKRADSDHESKKHRKEQKFRKSKFEVHKGDDTRLVKDERFSQMHTDPRFKHISKKNAKIKVDKRFQKMFDKSFDNVNLSKVDKYGRNTEFISKSKNDMKKFYELEDDETDEKLDYYNALSRGEIEGRSTSESENDEIDDSDQETNIIDRELDELEGWYDSDELDEHTNIDVGEPTKRIAIVNLDWSHITAKDLYVVMSSFVPLGSIEKVEIFPSNFGIEQMKNESIYGPEGRQVISDDEELSLDPNINQQNQLIKLRKYERKKMKYYFAVVHCDTLNSSTTLFDNVDGTEYLQTGNLFDMRYVPDNIVFDINTLHSECHEFPKDYKPKDFNSSALDHSNVALSWENDDKDQNYLRWGKMDIDQLESKYQNYIGTPSSSEDEDTINQKRHEIFGSIVNNGSGIEDEFQSDDEEGKEIELSDDNNEDDISNQEEGNKEITFIPNSYKEISKNFGNKNKSVFDEYLESKKKNRKERRRQKSGGNNPSNDDSENNVDENDDFFLSAKKSTHNKYKEETTKSNRENSKQNELEKAKLDLLLLDENEKNFDMTDILEHQKKKKKNKYDPDNLQDDFKINTEDSRFNKLFNSTDYAIDATDSHFKPTNGMIEIQKKFQKQINHKNNKIDHQSPTVNAISSKDRDADKYNQKNDISALIQSAKRKTQNYIQSEKKKIKK